MKRHLQADTPVNLNALQTGMQATPEGCQVIHVSSYGILLQTSPDDTEQLFSENDSVDIHLTVQHNGEQKKLTIAARVRQATDNSIDVEFQQPDPVLLDLIESYRTSDEHDLSAAISETQVDTDSPVTEPPPIPQTDELARRPTVTDRASRDNIISSMRVSALLGLLMLAGVLGAGYLFINGLDLRTSKLEQLADNQGQVLTKIQDKVFAASLLEGRYASLDARISAQGKAISGIEQKIHRAASGPMIIDRQPLSADAKTVPTADIDLSTATRTAAATERAAEIPGLKMSQASGTVIRDEQQTDMQTAITSQPAEIIAANHQTPTTIKERTADKPEPERKTPAATGLWIINLLSSPDRQYLATIAKTADSKDIQTELNSARVKGRTYWRLQVTGYDSLDEAKAAAGNIKSTLGLGDVWYLKRKPGS